MRVDAVIAGAGIAGIATAWKVADRLGETNALIVDPRAPLTLTSDRPEANYRNWWPHPAMVALADRSIDLVEGLLAAGASIAMNRRGYLYVTADQATVDGFPERIARYAAAGLGPDAAEVIVDSVALRERFPHLALDIRGAIHALRAGSLDTVALGRAMLDRASARGVRVLTGEVVGLEVSGGRVAGVRVSIDERIESIETPAFVNAAGPFAARLAQAIGVNLLIETVLRQKVLLRDSRHVIPRASPFTIGLDARDGLPPGVHIKPDDSVVPDGVKLGWAVDQTAIEPVASPACPPEYPRHVLERAATLVPGLEAYLDGDLPIVAHDGGFYARTPDGLPLIGPSGPSGAYTVSGLAGFGAMLAPGAGELAAGWLLGEASTEAAAALDPRRFDGHDPSTLHAGDRATTGEL